MFLGAQRAELLLLHGFHRNAASLMPLAALCEAQGLQVRVPELPTTTHRLWDCVAVLEQYLQRQPLADQVPIHLAGHSYGGQIALAYLSKHRIANLASLTCLGSAHQGTRIANVLVALGKARREPALHEFCAPGVRIPPPIQGWPPLVHLVAGTSNSLWLGRLLYPCGGDGRLPVRSALDLGREDYWPTHLHRSTLALNHHQLMQDPLVAQLLTTSLVSCDPPSEFH